MQPNYNMVGFLQNRHAIVSYESEIWGVKIIDVLIDFRMQYWILSTHSAGQNLDILPSNFFLLSIISCNLLFTKSFKMCYEIWRNLVALWELRTSWWSEDRWRQNQYAVSGWNQNITSNSWPKHKTLEIVEMNLQEHAALMLILLIKLLVHL